MSSKAYLGAHLTRVKLHDNACGGRTLRHGIQQAEPSDLSLAGSVLMQQDFPKDCSASFHIDDTLIY